MSRSDRQKQAERQQGVDLARVALPLALTQTLAIPKAIRTLTQHGIMTTDIARVVGVGRWAVWSWRKGRYCPRDAMVTFSLVEWARLVETNGGTEAPTVFLEKYSAKEVEDASL